MMTISTHKLEEFLRFERYRGFLLIDGSVAFEKTIFFTHIQRESAMWATNHKHIQKIGTAITTMIDTRLKVISKSERMEHLTSLSLVKMTLLIML